MTKKKIISRFMAALMAAFILCFSIVPVSAAEASDFFDESKLNYFIDPFYYVVERDKLPSSSLSVYDAFYDNYTVASLGYTRSNSFFMAVCQYHNDNDYWIRLTAVKIEDANVNGSCIVGSRSLAIEAYFSDFVSGVSNYKFDYVQGIPCGFSFEYKFGKTVPFLSYFRYDTDSSPTFRYVYPNDIIYTVFYSPFSLFVGPVKPDDITSDSHVYYGFPVGGINKKAFASWLVDEGKESVINSAGYSFTSKQIESLVDVWATYGYHPLSFLSSLTKTFNIVTELKGAIALTQTINQLYRDYQEYLNTYELSKLDDPVNLPHWRTDKEDTTLITDTEEDTTDTSLLRAILRAVVHLPSDIAVHFNYVKTGFNDILFDFQNQINVMADLPDNIGVAVANNINPTLNSIDNSVNALAVPLTDIDTNVNAMAVGVADIDANLGDVNLSLDKIDDSVNTVNNSVNSVNGSVNNLDVSLHEINNTLNDGSGSCSDSGGCSGSRPCTPDLPEAEFDDLYDQSGDFFKFWRDLLDSSGWIPASLFTAACLVAIFMRVWGR